MLNTAAYLLLLRAILDVIPALIQAVRNAFRGELVDLKKRYGDWAVVTGASDGIGKAYCGQLAARQVNLVVVGRNYDKLHQVCNQLEQRFGIQTKICIADFSKGRQIYDSVKNDLKDIPVGILVNNVGIQYQYPMPFADLPEDEIWDNVNVNLTSATMMTRIVLPGMLARDKGAIVNISSSAGQQPMPYMNLYGASKAYMTSFSDALREEVIGTQITVQTLIPFYVSSKINHFAPSLLRTNLFIPDADTYAASAIDTLGQIDHTKGYWPHLIQGVGFNLLPQWLRTKILAYRYKTYNRSYLKRQSRSR